MEQEQQAPSVEEVLGQYVLHRLTWDGENWKVEPVNLQDFYELPGVRSVERS